MIETSKERTVNVMRNSAISVVCKMVSLLCTLIMVPMTINYLNTENYGIWMAMTSVLYWFSLFDVGLGNGMRNYLAEALSLGDYYSARAYFSSAIFTLSFISILIGLIVVPLVYVCDLNSLFNTNNIDSVVLANVLAVAVIFSLVQFVVKITGMAYIALQQYAVNDLIILLGSILSVVSVFILTKTAAPNLMYVVLAFTVPPVLMFFLAAIPLLKHHPQLMPSMKIIDIETVKKIVSKGLGFFVIQISSCMIIFGSANLLISHFCGPEQVTVYNVSYKLFNVLIIGFSTLLSPLWNAYTDAATKGDYLWIKRCFRKSLYLWFAVTLSGIVLFAVSPYCYSLWVGNSVSIPMKVSFAVLLYAISFNFANCNACLLNGLNIIRMHLIVSVSVSIIYLVTILIWGYQFGIVGITICMAVSYLIMGSIYLYQCRLIISRRNTGIWSK